MLGLFDVDFDVFEFERKGLRSNFAIIEGIVSLAVSLG